MTANTDCIVNDILEETFWPHVDRGAKYQETPLAKFYQDDHFALEIASKRSLSLPEARMYAEIAYQTVI